MAFKATSRTKFKQTGKNTPSKKEVFKAITTKKAKVREWAGKTHKQCPFSPLKKGALISVCDAILSAAGNNWYYIKTPSGKYGFIYAGSTKMVSQNAVKFLKYLENYHHYIKDNSRWFFYKFMADVDSFGKAQNRIGKKKKVGITCLVPTAWALRAMGIKRADGKPWVSGNHGSFKHHYTGAVKKYLKRITKDGPIGKTVKQAVDAGLLKPGDILAFKDKTHTATYSGSNYIVFDGGHNSMKDGKYTGIKANYENYKHKISEVLRWRE